MWVNLWGGGGFIQQLVFNWNVNMVVGWGVNLGEGSKVIYFKYLFFNNEYSGI